VITAPAARPRRWPMVLVAVLLLAAAATAQAAIDTRSAGKAAIAPLLYLPSGRYLKVASLGFDGIAADVLYLWSIQYYSNYRIEDRYRYVEHIYRDIITDLDPHYMDAYLTGALIMVIEAKQPESALRLLDKGIASNPAEWILAFEAGYVCYNDLHDYPRAAAYFEKAIAAPDVHPIVRRFYAEMYDRAGDKRTSLKEWMTIEETAEDDYVRTVAWNHVHDLKVDVDLGDIKDASDAFRARFGRWPATLPDLARAGMLRDLPLDPEGRPYDYDRASGRAGYGGSRVLGR
jgi:tetratricopeptide (TPR) repeat protein